MKPRSTKKGRLYQRELNDNPYVDGIVGIDGNVAIRALSNEEFEFLDKFNNEFVEGNFERDMEGNLTETNLHFGLVNGTEDSITALKAEIKEVADKLSDVNNGYREMTDRKSYWKYKKNLYKTLEKLKGQLKETDITGNIYKDKYARRNDLMTYVGKEERTVLITDLFHKDDYANNEESLFEYVESTRL